MKTQFRNALHILIGALIGWILFQTFAGIHFIIQLFLTAFVIGVVSVMWEWFWKMKNDSVIDYWDVVRGIAGGLFIVIILNIL